MTGGRAFTFFIIAAMLTPLALMASVAFAERWAPSVHRWNQRHARGINWGLAIFFSAGAMSVFARPLPDNDPLDQFMHSTAGRVMTFGLCASGAIDHVRKARRARFDPATGVRA